MDRHSQVDAFVAAFHTEASSLMSDMESGWREGQESGITSRMRELAKQVNEGSRSLLLPGYTSKCLQSRLTDLESKYAALLSSCKPKSKFSFPSGASKKAFAAIVPAVVPAVRPHGRESSDQEPDRTVGLADLRDQAVTIDRSELRGTCYTLQRLSGCTVRLTGPPDTLVLHQLTGCTVTSAPVHTSVRVTECSDCRFSLSCHQLRIDGTTDSEFRVLTTAGPIIEHSSRLTFAPYDFSYPDLDQDLLSCAIDRSRDRGSQVVDFNWLSADQPSPNWTLVPSDHQS